MSLPNPVTTPTERRKVFEALAGLAALRKDLTIGQIICMSLPYNFDLNNVSDAELYVYLDFNVELTKEIDQSRQNRESG